MKDFKQWLLDRVNEEQKHIIYLQEQKNRQIEYVKNINNRANEIRKEAYNWAIADGADTQEACEFGDSAGDSFLDRYDNEFDEITNIDKQIEYHQEMLEVYRLAMKGMENETI